MQVQHSEYYLIELFWLIWLRMCFVNVGNWNLNKLYFSSNFSFEKSKNLRLLKNKYEREDDSEKVDKNDVSRHAHAQWTLWKVLRMIVEIVRAHYCPEYKHHNVASEADETANHIHVWSFSYFDFSRVLVLQIEMNQEVRNWQVENTEHNSRVEWGSEEVFLFISFQSCEVGDHVVVNRVILIISDLICFWFLSWSWKYLSGDTCLCRPERRLRWWWTEERQCTSTTGQDHTPGSDQANVEGLLYAWHLPSNILSKVTWKTIIILMKLIELAVNKPISMLEK